MFLVLSSSRAVNHYLQTLLLRVSLSRLGGKHRHIVPVSREENSNKGRMGDNETKDGAKKLKIENAGLQEQPRVQK